MRSRNTLAIMCVKIQASFKTRTYIKGRVNLNITVAQAYNDSRQIHGTSAVSKALVFRQHKNFHDGFTNLKDGSRPGQHKTVVIIANIAVVAGD